MKFDLGSQGGVFGSQGSSYVLGTEGKGAHCTILQATKRQGFRDRSLSISLRAYGNSRNVWSSMVS